MRTLVLVHLIHSILAIGPAQPHELGAQETDAAAQSRIPAETAAASPAGPTSYFPVLELRDDVCYDDPWWRLSAPSACTLDEVPMEQTAHTLEEVGAGNIKSVSASDATNTPTGSASGTINVSDVPFESFEDWKRREAVPPLPSDNVSEPAILPSNHSTSENTTSLTPPPPSSAARPKGHRYNYASPDCSARVLASSPLTQHASSLLHKSRDRYMLTPCRADEHWAIVELCDEIRVEAIELAVWEFFSGIVRSIRVSVSDDSEGEWETVAEFVGKNVRGAQTFTLPEPTSFRRFLRLDFLSFYGSEYYCPVSQLKVYGMNQMEAFKMEQRRAAEASGAAEKKARDSEREAESVAEAVRVAEQEAKEKEDEERRQRELCELERLVQEQARRVSGDENVFEPLIECAPSTSTSSSTTATPPAASSGGGEESVDTSDAAVSGQDPAPMSASLPPTTLEPGATAYRGRTDTSESIYAFITRRLNALEGNTTLVARYIDEQAKALRATLERAEQRWEDERDRDAARYDVDRMRQEDRLGRLHGQLEHMRTAFDAERRATEAQLQLLADELAFERRRSLAQLIVLVSIIVLGALSRGKAIDAILRPLSSDAVRRRRAEGKDERDVRAKRLSTGPLAGLLIDVALSPSDGPPSPSTPRSKRKSMVPGPSVRRRTPGTRSISTTDGALFDNEESPRALHQSHRGRISGLTPRPRRLARSSHLHAMRRRDGSTSEADPGSEERGTSAPRARVTGRQGQPTMGEEEGSTSEVEEVLSEDEDGAGHEPGLYRELEGDVLARSL
ncbi:hypothetical protein CspeluHIS016_0203080 [Cutaneotrichosporon spelunceum]|uniref:SUN domain-containing protein n=1 Tax=Cutaneotrichosporon spelunceum TaxID=1672016 RepID=A0AAD3YAV5_9TREE|nr:hypothetical protein CspeluHIS016_0203080 [Cutaneotrichosporon spelunceum]